MLKISLFSGPGPPPIPLVMVTASAECSFQSLQITINLLTYGFSQMYPCRVEHERRYYLA